MNESLPINPSWFVSEQLKHITEKYYLRLSFSIKSNLKQKLSELERKEDYVTFLNTDGAVIWEEFINDIAYTRNERNFSPLSDAEAEKLFEEVDNSFERFHKSYSSKNKKIFNFLDLNPLLVRFCIAITLLIGGFLVIYFTFYSLPKLSEQYQSQVEENLEKHNVQESLEQVSKLMGSTQSTQILNQLNGLEKTLSKIEKSVTIFQDATNQLTNVKIQEEQALINISEQKVKLDQTIDSLLKKKDEFITNTSPMVNQLNSLMTTINAWVEPAKLRIEWEQLEKDLTESSDAQKELLANFSNVWNVKGENWIPKENPKFWQNELGTAYINQDEYNAITKIIEWSKSSNNSNKSNGLSDIQKIFASLEQNTKLIPIEDSFKKDIIKLNEHLTSFDTDYSKIKEELSGMIKISESLKNSYKQLQENEYIKKLAQNSDTFISDIKHASNVIAGNETSLENRKKTLKKMEDAVNNLSGLARVQADLSFKGASPTVYLLLAIGGMFITFGLSSLLKWVKSIDDKKETDDWARKNQLYTSISASLIQHGVDPSIILSRLQNAFPSAGTEQSAIKFPISETIAEIGKMIKK